MTRLGLIARADNRGLGQQTWAVYRNLQPAKTLVVDCPSEKPLQLRLERFPDAQVCHGFPTSEDIKRFIDGVDVVYTAETGYGLHLWQQCDTAGVRSVLHANYEFWETTDTPTVLVAASLWNLDRYPAGTQYLPVPIETDRFPLTAKPKTAKQFLHVVGRPAIRDRNGTLDLLQALQHVQTPISLTITCQEPGYVNGLIDQYRITIPDRITLTIDSTDAENYWDKYRGVDAMVLPRRFGGLCLPANEGIGAGIPVIMPDIDPNNRWLPPCWLVKASEAGRFMAKQPVQYYRTDPRELADRIDQFASDSTLYGHAIVEALEIRNELRWSALKPRYLEL